jgi:hypothetical protein
MRFCKLQTRHWLLLGSALMSCVGVYGLHRSYELRETGVNPRYAMALTCVSKEDGGEAVFVSRQSGAVNFYAAATPFTNDALALGGVPRLDSPPPRSDFDFRYVGKRGPTDWYRVSWTVSDHPGVTEHRSEEFSFHGRPHVVIDDKRFKIVAAPWDGRSPLTHAGY